MIETAARRIGLPTLALAALTVGALVVPAPVRAEPLHLPPGIAVAPENAPPADEDDDVVAPGEDAGPGDQAAPPSGCPYREGPLTLMV
jgi:hypothetical protein